jgi:hypothetical protein
MESRQNILKHNPLAQLVLDTMRTIKAIAVYNRTGETPLYGVHSARHLYFSTNKLSHKLYTAIQDFIDRKNNVVVERPVGILGDMSPSAVRTVRKDVQDVGFHVFDTLLSAHICNELIAYARTTPSIPRLPDFTGKVVYDADNLIANVYDFDAGDLLQNPVIQDIITDESLLAAAKEILGPSVRLHNVSLWWSNANFENVSKSSAAQLYHVDMDTIKWVKFFFYLTDVTSENGPHCYIATSHRTAPKEVYREGRILDEEITQHFKPEDIKEITGPQGTMIAADTMGLHKGKALEKGERLMMQITFSTTLFGYGAPKKVSVSGSTTFSSDFLAKIDRNPTVYKDGYF